MKDKILFSIICGFAGGILIRSFWAVGIYPIIFILALAALCLAAKFIFKNFKNSLLIISIFIFALALGVWRFQLAESKSGDRNLKNQIGVKVKITGVVDEDPETREKNIRFIIKSGEYNGRILVSTDLGSSVSYGDQVEVSGKILKPANFVTSGGKIFDYVHYLAKDQIYYDISFAKVKILAHHQGSRVKEFLFGVKNNFLRKISALLPQPESSLMGGLLLGGKYALPADLNNDLIRTGTIHIVALSGFNVTIVAEAIMNFFKLIFSSLVSIYLGIFSIIIFAVMVGAGSTVIRAAIMATLALIARATGRTYDAARALLIAGFLMLIFNPLILAFDVSFQLSFLATVGIIFLSPKMMRYFRWLPEKFLGLRDIAATTAAAYVFVLPFLVYKMGVLSLVALPVNILILPFIPATMLFGFITGIFGFIWRILAWPFSIISYALLHYELGLIRWFGGLPFAAIQVSYFPLLAVIAIYVLYIYNMRHMFNIFNPEKKKDIENKKEDQKKFPSPLEGKTAAEATKILKEEIERIKQGGRGKNFFEEEEEK